MHDEAAVLGQRNELARRDHAARGVLPAHQRFEPDDFAIDARLRLIIQRQLVLLDGRLQFVLQRAAFAQLFIHFRCKETNRTAALALGPVQRGVRVGQ